MLCAYLQFIHRAFLLLPQDQGFTHLKEITALRDGLLVYAANNMRTAPRKHPHVLCGTSLQQGSEKVKPSFVRDLEDRGLSNSQLPVASPISTVSSLNS